MILTTDDDEMELRIVDEICRNVAAYVRGLIDTLRHAASGRR